MHAIRVIIPQDIIFPRLPIIGQALNRKAYLYWVLFLWIRSRDPCFGAFRAQAFTQMEAERSDQEEAVDLATLLAPIAGLAGVVRLPVFM